MPVVAMPDGTNVRFPDDMSKEEIRSLIANKFPEVMLQKDEPEYDRGAFSAATEGAQSGMMFGFDDELTGAMLSPIEATKNWMQGNGFDLGQSYRDIQQREDQRKAARREAHPIASTAGEIAGGAATAGSAAKAGITTLGRMSPMAGAITEGGAYGALYGAGESEPGERLTGAMTGGAVGAVTGGLTQAVGGAIANRAARKAMPAAPDSRSLLNDSSRLYERAKASGVSIKKSVFGKLAGRMKMEAGRLNQNLRPKTIGIIQEVDDVAKQPYVDIQDFDELRQTIGKAFKGASDDDIRVLTKLKGVMDTFADNIKPADVLGDSKAFQVIKDARGIWSRGKKAQIIENLMNDAGLKESQFSQSGAANAVVTKFRQLARNEKLMRGFSKAEREMIEDVAKGRFTNKAVAWLAKLSPRGGLMGFLQMAGAFTSGGASIPLAGAGFVAGNVRDKAAGLAAQSVRDSVAAGTAQQLPMLPMRPYVPLVAGQASNQLLK